MSERKLTVEFYDHKGPFDPSSVEKLDGAERLERLAETFKNTLESAGFEGNVDVSILGQATITSPTETVEDLCIGLPYTTFRHYHYD